MNLFKTLRLYALTALCLTAIPPSVYGLRINEFMASNDSTLLDENGDASDWIEIFNESSNSVDLAGWTLTDDISNLQKWTFPSISLAGGDYLVVFASSKDRTDPAAPLHTNFKLSSGGEYLALVEPGGSQVAFAYEPTYPEQRKDISYGLAENSTSVLILEEAKPCRTRVPTDNSQGTNWLARTFDDSMWTLGFTGMGYEAGSGYGFLIGSDLKSEMYNVNASAYMRVPFVVDDPAEIKDLTLQLKFDDGFAAYINGHPVASSNAPVSLAWNAEATSNHHDDDAVYFSSFSIADPESLLIPGTNMLAIHGLNRGTNSTDFLNMPRLDATLQPTNALVSVRYFPTPTPGSANQPGYTEFINESILFSHASGMYTDGFSLDLSSSNATAVMRYTMDGSDPIDSSPEYTAPISVTGSVQVKARLFEAGKAPGSATCGSYVFLAPDVQNFSSTMPIMVIENFGAGAIPAKGYSGTGAGVVQVPRQEAVLFLCDNSEGGNALLSQPDTISSMGIRGRGGYSSTFPHKPYSVELWDEEGNEKERKLLGMPSESDWVLYWPHPGRDQTLMYNTFLYELSNQVGHYAARTRFVNAFVNEDGGELTMNDRVGMYILMEKVKRDKNRLDFDKLSDDGTQGGWLLGINRMDAIPESGVGTPQYFHTAGENRIQQTAPNTAGQGDDEPIQGNAYLNFDEPNGYRINPTQRAAIEDWFVPFENALWGSNFSDPVLGYERYLDSDDFIDYFQLQNLTKNGDALLISLWVYKESAEGKLKMGPIWDFDYLCYLNSGSATAALRHNDYRLWYGRLFQDIDFEQRYIDRWQAHRTDVYSDANMAAIIDAQAAEITESIAAFHGVNNWTSLLAQWKTWIADRCAAIDSQYLAMPVFSLPGTFISPGTSLSLTSVQGNIYYTLDGSDPRGEGGIIAAGARLYTGAITLNTTTLVRARAKNGSNWSGIPEELFVVDIPDLEITEVMYHARNPEGAETNLSYSSSDYDFIEIYNNGAHPVSLLGVQFENGIEFDFTHSDVTALASGEHAVVVSNPDAFNHRYPHAAGLNIAGVYEGALDNNGERVSLIGPHGLSHAAFTYSDSRGWPLSTDGAGHALVPFSFVNQTTSALDYGGNWRAGTYRDGSPGQADPAALSSIVINEFAAHTDNSNPSFPHDSDDWIELFNMSASGQNLTGWYLSDSVSDLRKWALPETTVPSGNWVSFSETDGFNNPLGSGFGLNKAGEQIFLSYLPGTDQDRVANAIRFKGQENGTTLGRYTDGVDDWRTTVPTRDAANTLAPSGIVVSEVMYHPSPTLLNPEDNTADEYIVLHNPTAASIDLFNAAGPWRLDGEADFTLAGTTSLSADEYLVIVPFDPLNPTLLAAFQSVYGLSNGQVSIQGPFSGKLSNRTGKIALERPQAPDIVGQELSWVIVDELIYADALPWPTGPDGLGLSLHRVNPLLPGNTPENWLQGAPSPASAVIGQPPIISNAGGADNVTAAEASLHGQLVSEGADTATVTLYWGSSDGDRDPVKWHHSIALGTPGEGALVTHLTGLAGNTTYFYRFAASNSFGGVWANTSSSFTTLIPPTDFSMYPFRMKIDFPGYTSGSTLSNFPALIILNENLPNFYYADFASPTGGDLRFSDSTASTELNYEVEVWNTNGDSFVWVQVPVWENNTFIYAYWGNETAQIAPDYTASGDAWSDTYAGVWHLNDNAGGVLPDSTANNLNGTNSGAGNISGVIANGQNFDPGDFVHLGGTYIAGSSTTEAWVFREAGMPDAALLEGGDYSLRIDQWDTAGHIGFTHRGNFDAEFGTGIPIGSWHHIAWVFDGTAALYINGIFAGSDLRTIPMVLGTIGASGAAMDARVDELRVSTIARGDDYLDATYRTTAQNSSFTGYYPVEDLSATADSDGDGITDQWELDHSGSRTGLDANAQTGDNDGINHIQEFLLDYDPTVSNAPFSILSIQTGSSIEIIFGETSARRSYTLEYSTNLNEGIGWQAVQTNISGSAGTTLVTDPASNAFRYYRIRVP